MKFRSNPIKARVLEFHRHGLGFLVTCSKAWDLFGAYPASFRGNPKGGVAGKTRAPRPMDAYVELM